MRPYLTISMCFLGFVMFVASCTDTAVVDQNVAIPDHKWSYDNQPLITAHITDTTVYYDIYLNLRHTPDYRYANIFILLHQGYPDGTDTTERFELQLAAPDGRWLGRGSGSVYAHQQLIKESVRFPDTGNYVFAIEQNMRENPLGEITDAGIRIAPAE
ncbi:gliding motility lipoprotein GldH [Parapedobacter deserti]|uniref:Gliding motility lipoprotein GldH n=1 Tax=Parapedobacter deserti TaxID=1912957 RepID=A0ABV7JSB7_9SPHI